jgi:hypothetical protein
MPLVNWAFNYTNKYAKEFKKLLCGIKLAKDTLNSENRLGYDADFSDLDFKKLCNLIEFQAINPNQQNDNADTILSITAAFGEPQRLKKLLEIAIFTPANLGMALIYASKYNNSDCVKLLLEYGADVNWSYQSYDALTVAAEFGSASCVEILLRHGAAVNQSNKNTGTTALMQAIESRSIECIKLLLANGANIEQEDYYRNTAKKRIQALLSTCTEDKFVSELYILHKDCVIKSLPNIKDYLDGNKDHVAIKKAINTFFESALNDIIVNSGFITCVFTCDELAKNDVVELSLLKIKQAQEENSTATKAEVINNYMIQICAPGIITKSLEHNTDRDTIPGAICGSETVAFQTGKLEDLIKDCGLLCAEVRPEQNVHPLKKSTL